MRKMNLMSVLPVLFLIIATPLVFPGCVAKGPGGGGMLVAPSAPQPQIPEKGLDALSRAEARREARVYREEIEEARRRGDLATVDELKGDLEEALEPGGRLSNLPRGQKKRLLRELRAVNPLPERTAPRAERSYARAETAIESEVDQPTYGSRTRKHDFAVVVGVEDYPDLPAARFAKRDAESVREHLIAMGFPERNIVLLTGYRASRSGLVKNLETWLPNNVKRNSRVFFYYSGHGAPDPKTGDAYLLPFGGDPAYLKDTAYPLKRLYASLGKLKASSVIVALDACFSGAGGRSVIAKGTRPLVTKIDTGFRSQGKVTALTASAGNQIAGSIEREGHGLFTYYLLKGLNGSAQDGRGAVTVQSLYDYIRPKVEDAARRDNREQTPQLMGSGRSLKLR